MTAPRHGVRRACFAEAFGTFALTWGHVPGYLVAQGAGFPLAAGLLHALFGRAGHLGATLPHHGVLVSLIMEIVLTCLLVTVILGTGTEHYLLGADAALAVGATIALCGLFASPVSGASMNPARSLGPAIVTGTLAYAWLYVVGPLARSFLAVLLTRLLRGGRGTGEVVAVEGESAARRGDGRRGAGAPTVGPGRRG